MKDLQYRLLERFDKPTLPHAPFYHFEFGLRFELGGEENSNSRPILRFAQAYDRARAVSEKVFAGSDKIYALISSYGDKKKSDAHFRAYKACGIEFKEIEFAYRLHFLDDYEGYYRYWHGVELENLRQLQELLWLDIAHELPIEPSSGRGSQNYFVDFDKGIVLHAYDDRGMDVVAMDKELLLPIYNEFKDWLLDWDMKKMASVFEK